MVNKHLPLISVLVVLVLFSSLALTTARAYGEPPDSLKLVLDGQQLSPCVQPELVNGKVLLPLRGTMSALGAAVTWDPETQTITVTRPDLAIRILADQKKAYLNNRPMNPDSFPTFIQGKAMVPLSFLVEALQVSVDWQAASRTVTIDTRRLDLPVVGSAANLQVLLADTRESGIMVDVGSGIAFDAVAESIPQRTSMKANEAAAPADSPVAGADYTKTNVQVEGVDEADIVKTDGQYLYQVNKQRVVVARVFPATEMKIVSTLDFEDSNFSPRELYVDARYLVVIGGSQQMVVPLAESPRDSVMIYPPPYRNQVVKAIIYDITDKTKIKKVRELELEGSYTSSRKIGGALYLVANKSIPRYYIMDLQPDQVRPQADLLPSYRDTAAGPEYIQIGYNEIRYFPGCIAANYLIVAGLNLDQPEEAAQVSAFLGAGSNIYASAKNLYAAVTQYWVPELADSKGASLLPERLVPAAAESTAIYRFSLNQGRVEFQGKGDVPGTVLNQFSMDEYNGFFRIATTRGETWFSGDSPSRNNLYILDDALTIVGKVEDIAPGERIYSVRFMGDRGYMVTFKTVDPLFVIDLKDPTAPKILGALKIPGYSNYLHPYDENHLIGFGKDTIELAQKDRQGNVIGSMAFYQGMKIAIFDVSDVAHPVEKFVTRIGDRGTESELLSNHKALLFDRSQNLLAFPVTVMEVPGNAVTDGSFPSYGQFTFQGAYVYHLDLVQGFVLRGRITHLTSNDYLKAGTSWYDSDKNVNRIIRIDDTLYTLSNSMIKANRLDTLAEKNSLAIPQ